MDWEVARFNMVEQQIRPWNVLNPVVLKLLSEVKRENFVPAVHHDLALIDTQIPLGGGRFAWEPKLEARVVQEVAPTETDRVLEIGTGTGYVAALLAKLSKQVFALEIDAAQAETARNNLTNAGIYNVTVEVGDAALGWPQHGPYDVIVAGGAYPITPDFLFAQLAEGGRLLAVVGDLPVMSAVLYTKLAGSIRQEKLFETVLPTLINAPQPERFVF